MNIKEFFQRWYQGILTLSPERQGNIKILLQVGITIAYLGGSFMLFLTKYWYFGSLILFFFGQSLLDLFNLIQQQKNLKQIIEILMMDKKAQLDEFNPTAEEFKADNRDINDG